MTTHEGVLRLVKAHFEDLSAKSDEELQKELFFAVACEYDDLTRAWTDHVRNEITRRNT